MPAKKILIVDDEKAFAVMLKLNLEATSRYTVRIENSGHNVLDAALQFHPDLILLDLIMPKTDGSEIAFQIKNHIQLQNVPIIFLTAAVRKDEVEADGGKIGGYPFVSKTNSLSFLFQTIDKSLASL